jgi:DNA-binding NtrC family response regulator
MPKARREKAQNSSSSYLLRHNFRYKMMTQETVIRRKALVIEDEPTISRICARVLTTEGFDVDCATDGLKAKEIMGNEKYEICLSDIRTPGMNGMEFYEYLEAEHPELLSRTIFTSGDLLSPSIREFLGAGNIMFLPKPFTPFDLKKIVREAINAADTAVITTN